MKDNSTYVQKTFLIAVFLLAWFALCIQFYINVSNSNKSLPEIIIRYFSYFTIDSNIIVALCATFLLFKSDAGIGSFFLRQSTQTAAVVYIVIVGLIYNTTLRFVWQPQGIQRIIDELLHVIIPFLFLIYWYVYCNKYRLKWKVVFPWLIFPLCYIVFVLIRSNWSAFYPYPFLNIPSLGLQKVVENCIDITILFMGMGLIFIAIVRARVKKRRSFRSESL